MHEYDLFQSLLLSIPSVYVLFQNKNIFDSTLYFHICEYILILSVLRNLFGPTRQHPSTCGDIREVET